MFVVPLILQVKHPKYVSLLATQFCRIEKYACGGEIEYIPGIEPLRIKMVAT